MNETMLAGLAAILALGAAAQWLAWRLKLPSILFLLLTGVFVGPELLGWLDPDALFGELLFPIVSLSVGVLLFEGGLTLRLPELGERGRTVFRLVTLGAGVTWLVGALAARLLVGLEWDLAVLLGALLTVTGPTVVLPILRQIRPTGPVGAILKWEGILIDPVGAVLAVLVLEGILAGGGSAAASVAAIGVVKTLVVGGLIGIVGALALTKLLERYWIPDHLHNPVALALAVAAFALSNAVQHESGLLATTLMGVLLANQKRTSVRHIVEFKENIRVLIISSLFILLAARLRFADFAGLSLGAVGFVLALIVVARPLTVAVCTTGSKLKRVEKVFLAALAPRGIVAAAVSTLFALRLQEAGRADGAAIASLTFAVIIATVAFYGLLAAPLSYRLGLAVRQPQGFLIAGAHAGARALAGAVQGLGLRAVLVDTNARNTQAARMEGFSVYTVNLLSEEADETLDLAGIGRLVAMTPNEEVNSLAAIHYAHLFGRGEVYQLAANGQKSERKQTSAELRGRTLEGFEHLEERVPRGDELKATKLTEQFGLDDWRAQHGDDALPLFTVDGEGVVRLATKDKPIEPEPGQTLLALVPRAARTRNLPT